MQHSPLAFLLLAAIYGCSGKGTDDTAAGSDSSAMDSAGDSGETEEPEPVYTDLVGSLTYFEAIGGQTFCDLDISLTTTPYTGDCDDCTFAFNVEATITRDDSTNDCALVPPLSFVIPNGSGYHDLFLGFWKEYDAGGGYIYQNMLFTGYSYTYGTYEYPGPYYYILGYGGGFLGRTTFRDDVLDLDWYYYAPPYLSYVGPYYDACRAADVPASTESQDRGGEQHQGRVSCSGTTGDVWSFDVPDGGNFSVAVDTISDDGAFSPALILNNPDGCSVMTAKDNFLCTYPPPSYLCPSLYMAGAEGGTWQVVVLNSSVCSASYGEYVLEVDGATNVQLIADDFSAYRQDQESFLRTVQLSATLTQQ